jgi:hypothetical protein
MKRIGLVLVFLFIYQASAATPQRGSVRIHNGFLKADQYLNIGDDSQRPYATGLLDGIYMALSFGAPEGDKLLLRIATCVEGMKSSQVAAIIGKYVREHPEKCHWDLKDAGYNAML